MQTGNNEPLAYVEVEADRSFTCASLKPLPSTWTFQLITSYNENVNTEHGTASVLIKSQAKPITL